MNVTLLNDSYPPIIDGVANAVVNYALNLQKMGNKAQVITPFDDKADDSTSPWEVVRFASINTKKIVGYVTGIPFSPLAMKQVKLFRPDILHSHCPISSTILARGIRQELHVPLITTYHTKYDIDIKHAIRSSIIQKEAIEALVNNISQSDEVWVVSKGAGENLKSLGYQGEYQVMYNGVDVPRGRLSESEIRYYTRNTLINNDVPLFLFVGRLMWYKGIRIIIDALVRLNALNYDFKMVFIGKGSDEEEIKDYIKKYGLENKVIFLGRLDDRDELSAWYCKADLFLFPSTFDTNGLVVREAAARGLASVLIKGSCASEGVEHNKNGFLIDENPYALATFLMQIIDNRSLMHTVGEQASKDLYFSWADSVKEAYNRYQIVIDRFKSGYYQRKDQLDGKIMKLTGFLMNLGNNFDL